MRTFAKLAVIAVVAACVAASAIPGRLDGAAFGDTLSHQFGGLEAQVAGPVTLKLLPRPRLQIARVSARGSGGAVLLDVPQIKADLDIAELLHGRWRLAAATLVEPTVTIDLDRIRDPGLLLSGETAAPGDVTSPLRLRTRAGVLRTISSNPSDDMIVTAIDAAAVWPSAGGTASASGTLTWRGAPARFAAHVDRLADLATPAGSAASMQITSPTLTLSADGALSGEPRRRFTGHVAAVIPSLPKLLQMPSRPGGRGNGRVQLSGDVVASARGVSFSDASFRMNRGRFEGTLAIRLDDGRTAVEGTLATDLLDVDSLLAEDAGEGSLASLYDRPLAAGALDADVDLRISASKGRLGRLTFDDAALAILFRDGRLELSVDEADLYGGRIKGRAVARLGPAAAEAHAEMSTAKVDIAALSDALGGEGQIAGSLTGDAEIDGHGRNLREILASLDGHGQVAVDKGQLAGLSLAHALRRFGGRLPLQGLRSDRSTVFDKAVWGFSVEHGMLRIPDGKLTAPGVSMSFSGETRLPDGRVDLAGVAVETDAAGTLVSGSPRLPFTMRGSLDGSLVLVGHAGAAGLPSLVLPLLGTMPPSP